ncbi:hypothetical protein [Nocardioides sp. Kera G14]|uniref:hypothetical protein n=1 Tax=Nocardioides sp. Kera G14 TaxID=2884264 RepID=UPI001D10D8BE|nr:hypothetical protein [Nocardioides sp. Kera G14]UDY24108.1 hypothetical protein LH076_02085 [Nocardioides sp. Kera G14]
MLAGVRPPIRLLVGLACLGTLALHLLYVDGPLLSDEGGFAMVARWWSDGGGQLYGSQWVDRPPGLIAVFRIADLLGSHGVRVMAGIVAACFVLVAAWAGWAVRGPKAAAWAAWTAFFLMNTPLTETFALNGELVAATWTMTAVAAGLHAVRGTAVNRWAVVLGFVAGAASAAAVLTKQNFVDAAVFLGVLGLAELYVGRRQVERRRRLAVVAASVLVGLLVPTVVALVWARANGGIHDLVFAMYGFRVDAASVLTRWSDADQDQRMSELVWLALGSGIITLLGALIVAGRRSINLRSPLFLAAAAAGLAELVGVLLGGSYWPHYLIGISPMMTLAAGTLAVQRGRARRFVRLFVIAPVVVTLGVTPAAAEELTEVNTIEATGYWLHAAAEPADSLVVLYTHPNVIAASGLRPAYPYSWSLPLRTLDPQLTLLAATLRDPVKAPTWVVGWDGLHDWGLDADHQVETSLVTDYARVATVCGHPIWLRRGLARPLPAWHCRPPGR